MANQKAECRLDPIMHAYLDDLVQIGAYGKDKTNVVRRLIERGIQDLLEKKVIAIRSAADFPSADGA
jgi:hypothetical protein